MAGRLSACRRGPECLQVRPSIGWASIAELPASGGGSAAALASAAALREFPFAVQARVAGMSAATIDRALKASHEHAKKRRVHSTTKAGTLLKRQIAIHTFC